MKNCNVKVEHLHCQFSDKIEPERLERSLACELLFLSCISLERLRIGLKRKYYGGEKEEIKGV